MRYEEDIFAGYIHEDVMFCQTVDHLGGVDASAIFYCYLPFVDEMKIPSRIQENEPAGTITQLSCVENRGFQKIEALVETPDVASKYSSSGTPSDVTEFKFFLLGTRAELIGLSRKLRDKPFVFIVRDNNKRKFIIGTLESPAYVKNFDIQLGRKAEDDTGAEVKLRSNAIIYEYLGDIPTAPVEHFGDFDGDFDTDFD